MNKNITKPVIFLLILLLGFAKVSWSQQFVSELNTKLSSSDQQKLQKADELFSKGVKLEDDLKSANNEERKSQLKRLEAADYYQNANSKREKVYTENMNSFWKKYSGEKNLLDFAKKVEIAATDSFKKASGFRKSAEKEMKLNNRIAWLIKAENTENRALVMMQKVVYTYLSWPIEYDHSWVSSDDLKLPGTSKKNEKEATVSPVITSNPKTETPSVAKKDTIVKKDATTTPVITTNRPKTTMIIVKPKTAVPVVSTNQPAKQEPKDTLKASNVTEQKAINTEKTKTKDTLTKAAVIPPVKTQVAPAKVQLPPVTVVDKGKETQPKTAKPGLRDTTKLNSKIKSKEVLVGNDSSIYGRVKVKEDQIDKFNDFLKQKYPSKMEDYVINFQELDYSDVDALRNAWYKYQYGYLSQDSAAMVAAVADTSAKGEKMADMGSTKTSSSEVKEKTQTKQVGKEGKRTTTKVEPVVAVSRPDKGKTKTVGTEISKGNEGKATTTSVEGFIFRVQIVACRVKLDENTLKGIYSGPLDIMELHEDNWYKYAIGEFSTYKAARQLRDQSNIPGVFVIAYLNGMRVKITPAIAYKKFTSKALQGSLKPELIKYRIQVASSKTLLSETYVKNIYNGPEKVEIIKEAGWNKYMISAGKTYKEASELLKKVAVPGAFIIAYEQDTRIELQSAIKLTQ